MYIFQIYYDPNERPGVSNLISIHSAVSGKSTEEICQEVNDLDTGKYKFIVAEAVIEHLNPIRQDIIRLLDSPDYLLDILKHGQMQAEEIAEQTAIEVRSRLGLTYKKNIKMLKKKLYHK